MPESPQPQRSRSAHEFFAGGFLRGLGGLAWSLGKKIYALGLVGLVLWLSGKAFVYLIAGLILRAEPPPQIVDIPTRLDETALARSGASYAGVQATENPRSPLSHYHRLDTWHQPDRLNGCITTGCHVQLPHGKNKVDRAFLNMHATSLHCGVCHLKPEGEPLKLVWYGLKTGQGVEPPALLQAYEWLNSKPEPVAGKLGPGDQAHIVGLLRAAASQADGEPVLSNLADHLAAVRVESEEFARFIGLARKTVPQHFRGEYGAKLALTEPATGNPLLGDPGIESAVQEFLARGGSLGKEEREALLKRVHPRPRAERLGCSQCHRSEKPLLDLRAVGYPVERIEAITQPLVMQAIEHIAAGQPFHIPSFTGFPAEPGFGLPEPEKLP